MENKSEDKPEDMTNKEQEITDPEDAKEKMMKIRDKFLTLKWDYEHGQINPAKKAQYEKLKEEYAALKKIAQSK